MSLKSKIEAVIYASDEPVTLQQLAVLLNEEVQAELDDLAARQAELPLLDGMAEALSEPATQEPRAAEDATASDAAPVQGSVVEEPGAAEPQPSEAPALDASDGSISEEGTPGASAAASHPRTPEDEKRTLRERERAVRDYLRGVVDALIREYADSDRGLEIREVAGGFRFGTKPEYHDAVRGFVKSLKPALKLSLQALETLAVVAYKQPVTAAEISEIRGVDSAGVLGGLLTRKLIQTAGRKQVIGRPMLYKTTKEFLVRFGLKDIQELPSMEEFERMAGELAEQEDLPMEATESIIERANTRADAEHIREATSDEATEDTAAEATEASPAAEAGTASGAPPASDDEDARNRAPEPDGTGQGESSARNEASPVAAQATEAGSEEQESK